MAQQPQIIAAAPNADDDDLNAFLQLVNTQVQVPATAPVVAPAPVDPTLAAAPVVIPAPLQPAPVDPTLAAAPAVVPAPLQPAPVDPTLAAAPAVVPAPLQPAPVDPTLAAAPVVVPAPLQPAPVDPAILAPIPPVVIAEPQRPVVNAGHQEGNVPVIPKANQNPPVAAPAKSRRLEAFLAHTRTGDKKAASAFETYCDSQKIVASQAFELNAKRYAKAIARLSDTRVKEVLGWDLTSLNTETAKYAQTVRYLLDPSAATAFDKDKFSRTKIQNTLTPTGATPLHIAALYADIDTMRELIATKNYSMFTKDARGLTPFHYLAVIGTHEDYLTAKYDFGGNPFDAGLKTDVKDPGVTPVMIALRAGNTRFAKAFLNSENQNGVGNLLSAQDASLNFYLYGAAKGPLDTVTFIARELRGNINKSFGHDNVTVLMAAAHYGNIIAKETIGEGEKKKDKITYAVDAFLREGSDTTAESNQGYNAFEIAAKAGHLDIVQTLYAHKPSDYRQKVMARLIKAGEVKGATASWIQAQATTTVRREKHHARDAKAAEYTHGLKQPTLRSKELDEELSKQNTKAHQRALLDAKLKAAIEAYLQPAIDYLVEYNWDKTKPNKADQGAIRKGWDWIRSYMYYFWNFGHNYTGTLNNLTGGNDGKNIKDKLAAKADAEGKLQEFMDLLGVAANDRVEAIKAGKVGWFAKEDGGSFSKRVGLVHSQLQVLAEEVESIKAEIGNNAIPEGAIPAAPAADALPPVAAPVPQGPAAGQQVAAPLEAPSQAPAVVVNPGQANGPALFAQPLAAQQAAAVAQAQQQPVELLPPPVAMGVVN